MFTLLEAKGVAAVLLSGGSLFAGLLPKWLGLANRIEHSLFLSIILCFGAGVLLSTSILHILHDTVTALPNWGELFYCAGFMALYFVDELVQLFCHVSSEKPQRVHHHQSDDLSEEERLLDGSSSSHSKYGTIKKVSSPAKKSHQDVSFSENQSRQRKLGDEQSEAQKEESDINETSSHHNELHPSVSQDMTDSTIKTTDTMVKKMGLVVALCIHSILEGLAVGTQPTSSKVVVLLLAVSCHKLVITFCLGAELISDGTSFFALIGSLSMYSLSSGAGVLIGIVLNNANTAVVPMLQGLAGGSLLYITVGEILPRERFHKSHCNMPKTTGLIQFISVLFGIVPIAVLNMYLGKNDF